MGKLLKLKVSPKGQITSVPCSLEPSIIPLLRVYDKLTASFCSFVSLLIVIRIVFVPTMAYDNISQNGRHHIKRALVFERNKAFSCGII